MALAGQQDRIARPGSTDGRGDGLGAVGHDEQVMAAPLAGRLGALRDGLEDGQAVLAAGILVGHHDQPATLAGHAAHDGPLGGVPFAGRAEDGDEPGRRVGRGQLIEDLP